MTRIAIIIALTIAPASALPRTCSTWQDMRTCTSSDAT